MSEVQKKSPLLVEDVLKCIRFFDLYQILKAALKAGGSIKNIEEFLEMFLKHKESGKFEGNKLQKEFDKILQFKRSKIKLKGDKSGK